MPLKIAVVTPDVPDPFGNAAARWYYALAKGLALRGHRPVFLSAHPPSIPQFSLDRASRAFTSIQVPLQLYKYPNGPWLAGKWRTVVRPYSHFISRDLQNDLARRLRSGIDVVNLEQMWAGYLGMDLERSLLSVHHLELLDLAGAPSPSWRFLVSKHLMQRAERFIATRTTWIRATTDRLRAELQGLNPSARVFTVPVAIDPDLYEFASPARTNEYIGLIASFNWTPGRNAGIRLLTRVWPKVKRIIPDARLLIVGWHAKTVLQQFAEHPDVTVIENVPDTTEYFRKLSVLIYPLTQGSGMKIKLLEAMALGTPVVTSTEGAEGLEIRNGHEAFVEDDDDAMAGRVAELVKDRSAAGRMARSARALVEDHYSPMPVISKLEHVYEQVMSGES